jgi:hypothetical protein
MRLAEVSRGQHRNDAGCCFGCGNVNTRNLGEGVRGTHKISGKCAVRSDVVAKPTVSTQQGIVFDASPPGVVVSSGCWLTHVLLREDLKPCDR